MAVTCPACGKDTRAAEVCDHCGGQLTPDASQRVPTSCPIMPGRPIQLTPEETKHLTAPDKAIVVRKGNLLRRLHWISGDQWPRWRERVEERNSYAAAALAPVQIVEQEGGFWAVAETTGIPPEAWQGSSSADRMRLPRSRWGLIGSEKSLWGDDSVEQLTRLSVFLGQFVGTLESLHAENLAWLNFDPQALEESRGRLRITNLDLEVYRFGLCPNHLACAPAYAAPEVWYRRGHQINHRTDVFHLALLAYYWVARYLPKGFAGKGLASFGYKFPALRIFSPALPAGIVQVVERGLSLSPGLRQPTVRSFSDEFQAAVQAVKQYRNTPIGVRWEIGLHTRAGRAKSAREMPNQDHGLVRGFTNPDRALAVIADGVSCCDVGSGELASQMVCAAVEAAIGPETRVNEFAECVIVGCHRGADSLLEWAVEHGHHQPLIAGKDLMASTLLAVWLEGNTLALANVGDSRVYLLRNGSIERLTVDADLACDLLAAGSPPEDILRLGEQALGLRSCVGGVCLVTGSGELIIDKDYCKVALGRWSLLPNDVVVLCTDGLVEEGSFLDPAELAENIYREPEMSAEKLAVHLCDLADARQRLPSEEEPDGFGDNITCCVIKVTSG